MDNVYHQWMAGAPWADRAGDSSPTTRSRFPAICTICCHDFTGWGTSPACTPQLAFPAQILLPPRAIMTSAAHLDADCPNTIIVNTRKLQFLLLALITSWRDAPSQHTEHRGVKYWQGAHRAVLGRKEHPDVSRTKCCYKKRQRHLIASSNTEHIGGTEMPQIPLPATTEHPVKPANAPSPAGESFLEISTRR